MLLGSPEKNGYNNNEIQYNMENIKISENGYRLDGELKNMPVAFVNALRRIVLAELPVVTVREVEILNNNTHLVHEMLRHRVEMLPVNVSPTEAEVIRDTKIELRIENNTESRVITSDDFVVTGPRKNVLLRDRDLDTPMLFLNMKPNESVHIKATLGVEARGASHACVSTYRFHVDREDDRVKTAKIDYKGAPAVFENHDIQRLYSTNAETGRPNWFDFTVESIGVIRAKDLLKQAVTLLAEKIDEWCKRPIQREEPGWYAIESDTDTHTIGNLVQQVMYLDENVKFVSYRIPHPLLPNMVVRFQTAQDPSAVVSLFKSTSLGMCKTLLGSLQ